MNKEERFEHGSEESTLRTFDLNCSFNAFNFAGLSSLLLLPLSCFAQDETDSISNADCLRSSVCGKRGEETEKGEKEGREEEKAVGVRKP